jgi:hypothetical protein
MCQTSCCPDGPPLPACCKTRRLRNRLTRTARRSPVPRAEGPPQCGSIRRYGIRRAPSRMKGGPPPSVRHLRCFSRSVSHAVDSEFTITGSRTPCPSLTGLASAARWNWYVQQVRSTLPPHTLATNGRRWRQKVRSGFAYAGLQTE